MIEVDSGEPNLISGAPAAASLRKVEFGPAIDQALLNSMSEGVRLSDEDGLIVYTNRAEDDLFGYAPGELIGKHVSILNAYPPEEYRRIVAEVVATVKAHGQWEGEWLSRRKDGSEFVTSARITAVAVEGAPCWLSVRRDLTAARNEARRSAFMLALTDKLREGDHEQNLQQVSAMMGEHFACSRVGYGHLDPDQDVFDYRVCWTDGETTPLLGRFPARAFGVKIVEKLSRGETVAVEDLFRDPISDESRTLQTATEVDTRAILVVPFLWGGRLRTIVYLNNRLPRRWTADEVALVEQVAARTRQVIELAEAEQTRRADESRLRFLDALAQATIALSDADAVLATTTRLLGEHLGLSICAYADVDEDQDQFTIRGGWAGPGSAGVAGRYRLASFGAAAKNRLKAGLPLVIRDNREELPAEEAAAFQALDVVASICVPLVKGGRLTALMGVHDSKPRAWSETDLNLVREVAERSWAHVERTSAQADLRASETRLRLAMGAGRMAAWQHDVAKGELTSTPELNRLLGFEETATLRLEDIRARYLPGDLERLTTAMRRTVEDGERFFLHQVRFLRPDGQIRWFQMRAEFHCTPDRVLEKIVGVLLDVTDEKMVELALRERDAELEAALEAGALAIIDVDHRTGRFTPSPRLSRLFGYPPDRVLTLDDVRARYHPVDLDELLARATAELNDPSKSTFYWRLRLLLPGDLVRWIEIRGEHVRDSDGTILRSRGVAQDVTARKKWEEHQRLLVNELNHRVKNTLAVVQALAQQTFRWTTDPDAARQAFDARLSALSDAHNLLTAQNWESAPVRDIVEFGVGAVSGAGADRVRCVGPDVDLPPQAAIALALAVHELSTNALKYGALSAETGRVEAAWSTLPPGPEGDRGLEFVWRERGGPPVTPPERKGFGARLLERGLGADPGGLVVMDFAREGLTCTIRAPLRTTEEPPAGS